jgi:WD40 repeat protein
MVSFSDDMLITGCEDGLIRAVSVHPNKIVQIINSDFEADELVPISALSISHDKKFLASANHDYVVNLFDISELANIKVDPCQVVEE